MSKKVVASLAVFVFLTAVVCFAETYTPEPNNRVKINLGATPWKLYKGNSDPALDTRTNPPGHASDSAYPDASWRDIGVPYCVNDSDTFINQQSGGGDGSMFGGQSWYRKHFSIDAKYAGRKIFIEFEGAHYAAAVYINGHFIPGNSAYNPKATHVIGFMGFVVDATPYIHIGGADNVLSVYVTHKQDIYADPQFSFGFRFGQGSGGLFRPVYMHITDPVHVPLNVYSVLNKWGTYVATTAATSASATVRIQTNVQNESGATAAVTLTTKIVDATNTVVFTQDNQQSIAAGQTYMFDQTATVANPHLWYPNASPYGKPYMYKVYHIVKAGGKTLDVFTSPLGIRTITWTADYPLINGQAHFLWGASGRYDYPALGTAVPVEQQWRDVKLTADCNGRLWRPGHSSSSHEFVEACDAYGVMIIQPSGEGEGAFATGSNGMNSIGPYMTGLKMEIHRDMIVRDRNDPSVLAWESSNGPMDPTFKDQMRALGAQWDSITPRKQSIRGPEFSVLDINACTGSGCETGVKNSQPNAPAWGAEAWWRGATRYQYDAEIGHIEQYIQHWQQSIKAKCFGIAQWYLAEEPGEVGSFMLDDGSAIGGNNNQFRSIGTAMMDANRIPKLLYKVYKVAWDTTKPCVVLAHHWNRAGNVRVNAFSNCANVRLTVINASGTSTVIGTKKPNIWSGATQDDNLFQSSTVLPFQCTWDNVAFTPGTLLAEGLDKNGTVVCSDQKITSGNPAAVKLTIEPELVRPSGDAFQIQANGSDAAFILATVVDAKGNWCPTATNDITFSVSGDAEYRGGTCANVFAGQPVTYRAPLDHTLPAEGGMTKIAIKSRFTAGPVTVTAQAAGLTTGTLTYTIDPVTDAPTGVMVPMSAAPTQFSKALAQISVSGNTLRYLIAQSAKVSVDVLNPSGKVVKHSAESQMAAGWHTIAMKGISKSSAAGVYFVCIGINGIQQNAKRVFIVR